MRVHTAKLLNLLQHFAAANRNISVTLMWQDVWSIVDYQHPVPSKVDMSLVNKEYLTVASSVSKWWHFARSTSWSSVGRLHQSTPVKRRSTNTYSTPGRTHSCSNLWSWSRHGRRQYLLSVFCAICSIKIRMSCCIEESRLRAQTAHFPHWASKWIHHRVR